MNTESAMDDEIEKTKLSYSTWIRDVHLLCKLSIQSSRWIWFDESRSVGHFLFIIQHQIIFIIFYSLRYLHMILYLLSIYFFFIFLFLVFLFHFFVLIYFFYLLFISLFYLFEYSYLISCFIYSYLYLFLSYFLEISP